MRAACLGLRNALPCAVCQWLQCADIVTREPCAIGFSAWFPTPLRVSSPPQMATDDTNSLIEQRKAKLAALRAKGIDPFKNKFTPAETFDEARANYTERREVALAG